LILKIRRTSFINDDKLRVCFQVISAVRKITPWKSFKTNIKSDESKVEILLNNHISQFVGINLDSSRKSK